MKWKQYLKEGACEVDVNFKKIKIQGLETFEIFESWNFSYFRDFFGSFYLKI